MAKTKQPRNARAQQQVSRGANHNSGFTFIELSIVVFIIGLLAFTITAGQNVISASKVKSVISEQENYREAITLYKDKYFDYPGDMSDATDMFGSDAGNGDGNERVDTQAESLLAWQHLQFADMISQKGFENNDTASEHIVGVTVPTSQFASAGWFIAQNNSITFDGNAYNYLGFGAGDGSGVNDGPIMVSRQVYEIDDKLDDGLPDAGRVIAGGTGCLTSGAYVFNDETAKCWIRFSLQ